MKQLTYKRWVIEYDPDRTRQLYSGLGYGASEQCDCLHCQNFSSQIHSIFPLEVAELLNNFGIDYTKYSESHGFYTGGEDEEEYFAGVWYHFVGKIISGRDGFRRENENTSSPDFEDIDGNFSVGLSQDLSLVPFEDEDIPMTQINFQFTIPWKIEKKFK
jgi:hypothetical protein